MMSSQTMQTLHDPVFRNKMPLFDGTAASPGLSKPQTMSGFLSKQALQYSGAYFAYDPRAKERAGFSPPWSSSKAAPLDGRSPVSHLPGMEAQNHMVYRQQDTSPSEEVHSQASPRCRTQGKQGFTAYTKSPRVSSPPKATVRKPKAGGENSSPAPENSVYLAIPKPVYRHNPCCSELGCVIGQRYPIEHGSPRIPNTVYEHDWMQTNAHFAERPAIQMKAPDALLQQQRALQQDPSAEPMQTYSPSRARSFPVMVDPSYSSYPCTPTRTLFGSLSEQGQCLQTPPRGYPSLYPSHAPYEHMTSEVYQECSPMSKYGHLTQHPIFYYPQANVEVENRTQCKDVSSKQREHVPVILKHTLTNPREHFIVPQSLHAELSLPTAETLPNHPFVRGFEYPCYAVPRFHLNAGQIKPPLKTQHAAPGFHPQRVGASLSTQLMDHSTSSVASLLKEKPGAGLHADKAHSSSPFLHVDQTSPARRANHSGISPQRIQLNRFYSPLTALHLDRPILPPAGLDRLVDLSHCEAQVRCPKLQRGLPVPQAAWLPRPPCSDGAQMNGASVGKAIYSPAGDERSSSVSTSVVKGCLRRSISQPSPPTKIKEDRELCEEEPMKKRQKVENVQAGSHNYSPPMPVIDNVFSLAPYQPYLHASGVLFQGRSPQRTVKMSDQQEAKIKADVREKRPEKEEKPAGDKSCSESSAEKPVVEITQPKTIKVEKVEPSDTEDDSVEAPASPKDCSKETIKKEPDDTAASDVGSMLVIKMCEPEELEAKPLLVDEASDEPKPTELATQVDPSSQGDAGVGRKQGPTLRPKPDNPSQPPVNFKNIPPQCLKLSTYKILLPETRGSSPMSPPEKPPPLSEFIPKMDLQAPIRKHFLELHNALCKLVSKSVSASSDQELRTWLSQMKIPEPTSSSTKAQKVSSLLWAKARGLWLSEEMKSALGKVMERLREYTVQERCPFPHVMRAGAVFLPMLVVKELLFPTVQGSFIDQVLQEHKVELRPTTLSEEKILIQLHKRACSSRLRRLMSLKHLPDIYADVVNLFYYSCVCRRLGLDTDDAANREQSSWDFINCPADIEASPASPSAPHPQRRRKHQETTRSYLKRNRTKNKLRGRLRCRFLSNSLSDEEEESAGAGVLSAFRKGLQSETESRARGHMAAEDSPTGENSWTCPISMDELSHSDTETDVSSSVAPGRPAKPVGRSKNCSGVILKLRRMFGEGLKRKKACYQAVSDTEALPDAPHQRTDGKVGACDRDLHRTSPKVTHKWQRTGNMSHALRPLRGSSKRKHSSLLKIKYCPYLSACHSAEHRRRWVLRSAVQRARRAMRFYYPDLVGKKIHHLYEEDDKSEVWYRGEVLRIHEAHSNPLKTVFEVRYDSEPEWKYYLELLIDYKKGWLKIED